MHDLKLKIVIFKLLKNLGIGLGFKTHGQNYGFGHPPCFKAKNRAHNSVIFTTRGHEIPALSQFRFRQTFQRSHSIFN